MPNSISIAAASAALNAAMATMGPVIKDREEVYEYASFASFPATGLSKKLYLDIATGRTYRWNGSAYVGSVNTITGNAGTATKLQTARTIAAAGDATGSASFDGSANATITLTLADTAVVAGSYGDSITIPTYTVDSKGRVTAAAGVAIRTGTTAQTGVVQLSTATNSTSTTLAATPSAVKAAYDLAAAAIPLTQRGAANGVPTLDANGLIPSAQLPGFVDDVLEYPTLGDFPASGAVGKIYVAVDTLLTYRWGGTTYVEISASPGSTDVVPEGSVNLYYTDARARAAVTTITGNAATASKLQTARTITLSGDLSGSVSFDGSANAMLTATIDNSGVTAGTYGGATTIPTFIVDSQGRITSASNAGIRAASTLVSGVVQLMDSYTSNSVSMAPTCNALMLTYNLASTANTAANAAIPSSQKGAASGVATLDTNGLIPVGQMPTVVAETNQNNTWTKAQRGAVLSVTAAAGVLTLDMSASNNFEHTLSANTTLALPTNIVPGQSGVIRLIQDATGSRTLAFNSVFKFAGGVAPQLSTAPGAIDQLCYYIETTGRITVTIIKDIK